MFDRYLSGQQVTIQTRHNTISETKNHHVSTKKLVLFDFDGTITTKDTLIEFVHFYRGRTSYLLGMMKLTPVMVLYALKIIPNWKAKQFFLALFFKGEKMEEFNLQCFHFATKVLPSLIRSEAENAIRKYRAEQATIAVVSASPENWVKPWCDLHGIICLSTRLEVKNGIITGKIEGHNCYGDEKACRVKEYFNLSDYDQVIAFGDSRGDKEMLALANEQHYKPFRSYP
jgi:phosphatidylglycerophosphatase C